ADAAKLLGGYHWPGNVRELENIVTRACVLSNGQAISADQIRPWLQQPGGDAAGEAHVAASLPVGSRLDVVERQMIVATLERYQGHRGRTAEALGIGVRTLSGKLRSYGYAPREKDFSGDRHPVRQNLPAPAADGAAATVEQVV
ncbi:MAG: helix-turn-helix domain-containing protein, partial [Planctomycetota bacterium]